MLLTIVYLFPETIVIETMTKQNLTPPSRPYPSGVAPLFFRGIRKCHRIYFRQQRVTDAMVTGIKRISSHAPSSLPASQVVDVCCSIKRSNVWRQKRQQTNQAKNRGTAEHF